jgi:CubicO group peptidase (beta-lactamase class C family)
LGSKPSKKPSQTLFSFKPFSPMMYKIMLVALLASLTNYCPALSQNKTASLDSLFTRLYKQGNFNGNVLVAEQGKTVYKKSFGYADVKRKTPNTEASTFQTASISKVFTATAVLQLKDKGKLQLSDPLVKYLPDFPFANITIKHLLTHTSGLPNDELFEPIANAYPDTLITNQTIIPALRSWSQPLYFQPGEKWRYSNTNYGLLVVLVEQLGNLSFEKYAQQYIFSPAQMTHTYVLTPATAKTDKNKVSNHFWPAMYSTQVENIDSIKLKDTVRMKMLRFLHYNLHLITGPGNVISTTGDLLKFDQALYSGKLLSAKSMEEAFTPVKLNTGETYYGEAEAAWGGKISYGLGWVVRQDPERGKIVGHDGFAGGIATIFYRNLTKKQTVIAFDNTVGYDFDKKVAAATAILDKKQPVPVSEQKILARLYGEKLLTEGPEAALIYFNERRSDTTHYWYNEQELNRLGYAFLHNGYEQEAVETFRLNIILYPTSFNVYDSYGETLMKTGKKEEAILMYKKSLALNPDNRGGKEALQQLLSSK